MSEQDIFNSIKRYIAEDMSLGLTPIVDGVVSNLAQRITHDLIEISPYDIQDLNFTYKANHYNLNFLCARTCKVKIFLGTRAEVARINYEQSQTIAADYYERSNPVYVDTPDYRIEVYKYIVGRTFADLVNRELNERWVVFDEAEVETVDNFLDQVLDFIVDKYYNSATNKNKIVYPNDSNYGNFVLTPDKEVVNIDYDHIVNSDYHLMIHNIAWQFIPRLFDRLTYPDTISTQFLIDYRKSRNMFTEVRKFKQNFYKKIDKYDLVNPELLHRYPIELGFLNNSRYLIDMVKEYNEQNKHR